MKYNVLLWGTGERAKKYIDRKYLEKCNIKGFIDTYKKEELFMGIKIYSPDSLKELMQAIDFLLIVNQHFLENLELCIDLGIEWEKIIITDNVCEPLFRNRFLRLKDISEELFNLLEDRQMKLIKINESDLKDKKNILGKDKYNNHIYMQDYFRYRTFEFAANQILENNIEGEVAELGVFRGTFASIINEMFPEKKLYLFDTFKGFELSEAKKEVEMGRCDIDFVSVHKNTSIELLLSNLPHREKVIICKGLFPDSVTEKVEKEKYAFVSLDVDFEESTYQGLKFFYPRLSEGGMIFLHDYSTCYLDGVKCAVNRFEKEYGLKIKKIPLADRAGTLVIIK